MTIWDPYIQQAQNQFIQRKLRQGWTRNQILDYLNGKNGLTKLTRAQLRAIGFGEARIDRILANQKAGKPTNNNVGWPGQPAPKPAAPGAPSTGNNGESAFTVFRNFMASLGIPMGADIEAIIRKAVTEGYGPADMYLVLPEIQQTTTWRNRFPGWDARVTNGFNQLEVGEYLALEDAYHRILQSAGLPAGFYDSPADWGQWIANDVAPEEVQSRVDMAMDLVRQVPPEARDLLTKFYGVGAGDLASYFLDQSRALPVLDKQYKAVNVAQWAVRNGLQVFDSAYYEGMVDDGITPEMAIQGYATVKAFNDTLGQLGGIYEDPYSQLDAEQDVFYGKDQKRRDIVKKEIATFSGQSSGDLGKADRGTSY